MTIHASDAAELVDVLAHAPGPYERIPLAHHEANPVTAGICRYRGQGWSLIRKHLTPHGPAAAGQHVPEHWNYWRREALAYRSGLASDAFAGSGIDAPALRMAQDQPDGSVVLWLEDVPGLPGEQWDVARVVHLARQLGRGQGSYLAGRPLPQEPWLSRRWLRQYVESKPLRGALLHDDAAWQQPAVRDAYAGLRDGLVRLWEDRDRLFDLVEGLPPTLCHLDVWPKNLIARREQTVLLDWSHVGLGAPGEDAGNLVPDCIWDGWFPLRVLPELADGVWQGYLGGLREAGWTGEERLARIGFTAAAAVKYAWLAEWSLERLAAGDFTSYGGYSSPPAEELLCTYGTVFRLLLSWAEEARRLAA